MRARLAESVAAIAREVEGSAYTQAGLAAGLARLRSAPAAPGLFALYHDIAVAARRDEAENAALLLEDFVRLAQGAGPAAVASLCDAQLGPGMAERYRRMIDDDAGFPLALESVTDSERFRMRENLGAARALIAETDPGLAAEIAVAGREIVLARGPAGTQAFSGAASFFLWGALVVNPETNPDRLSLAETLVHESGHALLFAAAGAAPLTLNAPEESYASPLRQDKRPMEGIVHATYVLARMLYFIEAALKNAVLSEVERRQAEEMRGANQALLAEGLATVRAHAVFSPEGEVIFERGLAAAGL